jgi:hypothetical protein
MNKDNMQHYIENIKEKNLLDAAESLSSYLEENYLPPGSMFFFNGSIYHENKEPDPTYFYTTIGYKFVATPFETNEDNEVIGITIPTVTYSTLEDMLADIKGKGGNYYLQVFMLYLSMGKEMEIKVWPNEETKYFQSEIDDVDAIFVIEMKNGIYECKWGT